MQLSNSLQSEIKFEKNLNGIRAIAVLGVVFFHYKLFGFNSGFVGVDIFFFLSGYLMTKILTREIDSTFYNEYKNFVFSRLRRILPGLAALLLITYFLFYNKLPYPEYINFSKSILTSLLFTSNNFFASESDYFAKNINTIPLVHTWSLSIEFQFYILYSLLILFIKYKLRYLTNNLYWILLCITILFFLLTIANSYSSINSYYYILSSRIWEFLIGGLFSFYSTPKNKNYNLAASILCDVVLICLLIYCFVEIKKDTYPNIYSAFPILFCMLLFFNKNNDRSIINKILNTKLLQSVGYISYSLYLWHWVIYVFINTNYAENDLTGEVKLLALLISFLIATISYYLVELPVKKRILFQKNSHLLIAWICIFSLSLFCIIIGYTSNNNYARLPEYLKSAEIAITNINPRRKECFLEAKDAKVNNYNPTLCQIGDNQKKSVEILLWGDSHADSIQPVLEKTIKDLNTNGVVSTSAGCAPLPVSAYANDLMAFSHCKLLGENTQRFINANLTTLKIVVFHANWARYDFEILNKELVSEICFLKKNGIQPILINQVPIPPYDVPIYWFNKELKLGASIDNITFESAPTTIVNKKLQNLIIETEASCGKIVTINPENIFCKDSKCMAVKDKVGLYYDITHLSIKGSLLIHQDLFDSINLILEKH